MPQKGLHSSQLTHPPQSSAVASVTIRVLPDPTNKAPVATAMPDAKGKEGVSLFVDVGQYFVDPDGDRLDYYISGLPVESGLTLKDTGMLTGKPSASDAAASPLPIRVLASDRKASTIASFSLTVEAA